MKRLLSLTLIVMLIACMSQATMVFAVPGEDAHSGSMNVEADGEQAKTKQAQETNVTDVEVTEEELQQELEKDQIVTDEDQSTDDVESTEGGIAQRLRLPAAIGSCIVIVLVAIAMVVGVRRRRQEKDGHQGKH